MFSYPIPTGLERRLAYGNYVRNTVFPQLRRYPSILIQGIRIRRYNRRVQFEDFYAYNNYRGITLQKLLKNSSVYVKEKVECSICYEEEDTIIRKLSCGHEFHLNCIDKWLCKKQNCPYCRKVLF